MASCPKCGAPADATRVTCPSCGVILAKARPRPGTPPPSGSAPRAVHTVPEARESASPLAAGLRIAGAIVLAGGAWMAVSRLSPAPTAPVAPSPAVSAAGPANGPLPALPEMPAVDAEDGPPFTAEEVQFINDLGMRLKSHPGAAATPQDLARLDALRAARPSNRKLRDFISIVLFRSADEALRRNASDDTDRVIERLKALDPRDARVYEFEAMARFRRGDWPGVEVAARNHESVGGTPTLSVSLALATALERQSRPDEAATVLARPEFRACASPAPGPDASACQASAQLRQRLGGAASTAAGGSAAAASGASGEERMREAAKIDASKEQIQSDRFDVRFDGTQNGVARDVLFVLDRAYSRLSDIYFDRPHRKIPVVLHTEEDYFLKTGAPWWSGGVFRPHDGTIQIPIRGLPSTLPREMEDVLVHELSHAFVDEMSGGFAGRDLQEGLAQFMEGKRIEKEMSADQLKRLANTRRQSVMSFYMLSLVISEQLIASRGQASVNQLLKAMREAGSENGGYVKTFGRPAEAMKSDILETFWKRYS